MATGVYVQTECTNPECRRPYRVKAEFQGKTATCKGCGRSFTLMAAPQPAIPSPEKPAAVTTTNPVSAERSFEKPGSLRVVGFLVSIALTTLVLLWGLSVYSQPGRVLALPWGTQIPLWVFLLVMLAWYGGALERLVAGVAEMRAAGRIADQIAAGTSPEEVLRHELLVGSQKGLRGEILEAILVGEPQRRTIDGAVTKGEKRETAILMYKLLSEEAHAARGRLQQVSDRAADGTTGASTAIFRGVVVGGKQVSFCSLRIGDVICSVGDTLVESVEELTQALALRPPGSSLTLCVLRPVTTNYHPLLGFENSTGWTANTLSLNMSTLAKFKLQNSS